MGRDLWPGGLLRFGERLEYFFIVVGSSLEYLFTRETMRLLLIPVRRFFVGLLVSFQHGFNTHFSKLVNLIRGRGTLAHRGEASAFLKDIAEYKESQREFLHNAEKM